MSAAMKVAKRLGPGQRVVVIITDSVRNYMSKFLSDDWMIECGFAEAKELGRPQYTTWWAERRVRELDLKTPITISPGLTCKQAINLLTREGFDTLPVISSDGKIMGVVTEGNLTAKLVSNRVKPTDDITAALYTQFRKVTLNTTLGDLAEVFDRDHYALVVTEQLCYTGQGAEANTHFVVSGIVTRIDLLNFITATRDEHNAATAAHASS